ncbi:hypothetical protein T11_16989 [Trichinella zimbabwensis]|uniref:Uncharacterized protein n=1 Tax=Trichinella zimbabwensis TaxID=268475 RepID=A0A0V1H5G5_9BILA|nr:hypothetical protein T11_16989 [Trichinella zimbabwensis]
MSPCTENSFEFKNSQTFRNSVLIFTYKFKNANGMFQRNSNNLFIVLLITEYNIMQDIEAHHWMQIAFSSSDSFTGNSPVVVEIIASKVGIACVNTLEAARLTTDSHLQSFVGNCTDVFDEVAQSCAIFLYFAQLIFSSFFVHYDKFNKSCFTMG